MWVPGVRQPTAGQARPARWCSVDACRWAVRRGAARAAGAPNPDMRPNALFLDRRAMTSMWTPSPNCRTCSTGRTGSWRYGVPAPARAGAVQVHDEYPELAARGI